jgi:hypothetical protein
MNKLAILACGAAFSLALATASVSADQNAGHEKRTLQGAWQVTTTVRAPAPDCTVAPPVGSPNPFPTFNTFHEGGTMSEWGSRSPPAQRSSGHGVWKRVGHNRYAYRLMFHSFDPNGFLAATMDIRSVLKLAKNGKTFTGVSRFVRTDLSGNVLNFCATLEGERFTL